MITNRSCWISSTFITLTALGVVTYLVAPNAQADPSPASLRITNTGTDFEGRKSLRIEWTALSNATYLVQSTTALTGSNAWETVDIVTPTNGAGQYEIKASSIPGNSVSFLRLVLPQPQIFSVEPAVFAPGAAVDVFVLGQCFESNDVVRLDGAVLGNVVYVTGGLLKCTLPSQAGGTHLLELLRGGVVRS